MKAHITLAVVCCSAALWSACWSTSIAHVVESLPQEPPEKFVPGDSLGSTARPDETIDQAFFRPGVAAIKVLPGGIAAIARAWSEHPELGQTAVMRFGVPVGAGAGEIGVAHLAARALAELPGGAGGEPSLRRQLEQLGGDVELRVGSRSIGIEIQVPTDHWQAALTALVGALSRPTHEQDQLELLRTEITSEARRYLTQATIDHLLALLTRGNGESSAEFLAELADRTAAEVENFHRVAFRAGGSALALWIPGVDAKAALASAESVTAAWAKTDSTPPNKLAPRHLPEGIHWAESAEPNSRIGVVIEVPHFAEPRAAELLVLLETLTMPGGRLDVETEKADPMLTLQEDDHWDGATRYRVMKSFTLPEQVGAVWQSCRDAVRSLQTNPPAADELRAAMARVRLWLASDYGDANLWTEAASSAALHGTQLTNLAAVLSQLDNPDDLDLAGAAVTFAARPMAMMVVGGERSASTQIASLQPNAFFDPGSGDLPTDRSAQIAAAAPYIERALAACGGRDRLASVTGFSATLERTAGHGADTKESFWFRAPDQFRRVRRILSTTIETVIAPGLHVERAGAQTVTLDDDEVTAILDRVASHPLLLLASIARREVGLRIVDGRTEGGREMVVLQRVDATRDRLRVVIDKESGLIRSIESRDWRPEHGSRVHTALHFSDYRTLGGLRAPFYWTTSIGPDRFAVVTKVLTLQPGNPEPRFLKMGGPVE